MAICNLVEEVSVFCCSQSVLLLGDSALTVKCRCSDYLDQAGTLGHIWDSPLVSQ